MMARSLARRLFTWAASRSFLPVAWDTFRMGNDMETPCR